MVDDGDDLLDDAAQFPVPNRETRLNQEKIRFVFIADNLQKEISNLIKERESLEKEDIWWADNCIAELQFRLEAIRKLLVTPFDRVDVNLKNVELMQIPFIGRWHIYSVWKQRALEALEAEISVLEAKCRIQINKVKDVDTLATAELIRGADIVGITTTGAAKQGALLAPLKSKIGKKFFFFKI